MTISKYLREKLIEIAREAAKASYSPYSKFPVGAALLASDGRVFTGCNVENASYGASCCAERVALNKAVSEGSREFLALAVTAKGGIPPCGICRQALLEFCGPSLPIFCGGLKGPDRDKVKKYTLGRLAPEPFGKCSL